MKTNHAIIQTSYITILCLLFISCISVKKFKGEKNPTEFVFNSSIEEITHNINVEFYSNDYNFKCEELDCVRMLVYSNTNHIGYDSIFDNPNNHNDLVLLGDYKLIFVNSDVYFRNNMPMKYSLVGFHLHIEKVDSTKTKIKVSVLKPQIVLGNEIFYIPSHRGYRYKNVEPTTIEEYKILCRIGKTIGEKMPPIILPSDRY